MHAVRGTLTHNGESVSDMLICFEPIDRDQNPASEAITDQYGRFELRVGKTRGVMSGEYIVYVQDPASIQGGQTSTDPNYLKVLEKYGSPELSGKRIMVDSAKTRYELKLD